MAETPITLRDAKGRTWTDASERISDMPIWTLENLRLVSEPGGWVLHRTDSLVTYDSGKQQILEAIANLDHTIKTALRDGTSERPYTAKNGRVWTYFEGDWRTPLDSGGYAVMTTVRNEKDWTFVMYGRRLRTGKRTVAEAVEAVEGAFKTEASVETLETQEGAWLVVDQYSAVTVYLAEIDALRAVNEAQDSTRAWFVPNGQTLASVRGF